jgi:hypothetical protein
VYVFFRPLPVQLKPRKKVWHEMIKGVRHKFKQDLGRIERQLSKTSEEIVPKMDCSGTSATLQYCASSLTKVRTRIKQYPPVPQTT